MSKKTKDFDKNETKFYFILSETAQICARKRYVGDDDKLLLEWTNDGSKMVVRDVEKYLRIFRETDYYKSNYKVDSFNRRLTENGFKHKLTLKNQCSQIEHEHFHRDKPGFWPNIRNKKTRQVTNNTSGPEISAELFEGYKEDYLHLLGECSEARKNHYELETKFENLAIELESMKIKCFQYEQEKYDTDCNFYEVKRVINEQKIDTDHIVKSSEFSIPEPVKKHIRQDVNQMFSDKTSHIQPGNDSASIAIINDLTARNDYLKQKVDMYEAKNLKLNTDAFSLKAEKDLQEGFITPVDTFGLDESTQIAITADAERKHEARFTDPDSAISVSSPIPPKRRTFSPRVEISEKNSKKPCDNSTLKELVLKSSDFDQQKRTTTISTEFKMMTDLIDKNNFET